MAAKIEGCQNKIFFVDAINQNQIRLHVAIPKALEIAFQWVVFIFCVKLLTLGDLVNNKIHQISVSG